MSETQVDQDYIAGDVVRLNMGWNFGDPGSRSSHDKSDRCTPTKWEIGDIGKVIKVAWDPENTNGHSTPGIHYCYVERSYDKAIGQFIMSMLDPVSLNDDPVEYEMCPNCTTPSVGLCVECR